MNNAAVWSYLHDGSLDRVEGSVPGDVSLFISIPYLRKAFQPAGEGFVLELKECSIFQLVEDDGEMVLDLSQIAERSPELLSIVSESPLSIYTTRGTLTLAYGSLELFLDSGQALSVPQLDQASAAYWQAWSARNPNGA